MWPGRGPHRRHVARIGADQHDVGRLDRHVRARTHRDPHVGLGEGRRVVHAVAGHGHRKAARLDLPDFARLLVGQDLGEELIQGQLARYPASHRGGVAGEHHHPDAHGLESGQRFA
jgi:hypothetical protein